MSADTLSLISILCFVAAAVCAILAVVFFVYFKIPDVIGDLSGRNAKRSIEQLRQINERSGKKSYKPSKINKERGKLTETIGVSKDDNDRPETGLIAENLKTTHEEATTLLNDENATELLQDEDATTLLDTTSEVKPKREGGMKLTMLDEVVLVDTDEVIG